MAVRDRALDTPRDGRRGRLFAGIAAVTVAAVLTTIAVTAQGYDVQEIPREDAYVWVMRDSGQYARVNTSVGEIDTVRSADEPSDVFQDGSDAVLYGQGLRQRWDIDASNPTDLIADASTSDGEPVEAETTPSGTRDIASAGGYVAYRTESGEVSVSGLAAGTATSVVDPYAGLEGDDDEDAPTYVADAIGLSPSGTLALYSAEEAAVRVFDIDSYDFDGDGDAVTDAPDAGEPMALTVIGDTWVMLDAEDGLLWIEGHDEPVDIDVAEDARLQSGADEGDDAYIADSTGLVAVSLSSGEARRVAEESGTAAQPISLGGRIYAAWVSDGQGTLWGGGETTTLEVPGDALDDASTVDPVFRSNGDVAVLSETGTGLLWTVPEGELIPLEQWEIEDETEKEEGSVVVEDVAEQEPPVAVDDAFGVRSGRQVSLPVLLNDHDPNKKDVLTVDQESVANGLSDADFGELSLADDGQTLVVDVSAASGQASFTYAVTDGAEVSDTATVTLTVVGGDVNSAPVWCGVDACQQEWPTVDLLPGGSVIVPVLSGWVDPEGDAFVLSDAYETDSSSPLLVVPMSDGNVAIRHTDANAADETLSVTVEVQDAYGAVAEKKLEVRITGSPALSVSPVAVTALAGETAVVDVADHTTNGSGSYRLVDAVQTSAENDGLEIVANTSTGEVEITAPETGQYVVTYTVQDTETEAEQSAVIRVTAVDGGSALTMRPITAFVRDGEDTTVDVLRAVQNTSGRVLILASAKSSSADVVADVVAHETLRLTGSVDEGRSGALGSVTVSVADGAGAAVSGTVTVFGSGSSTAARPIAFPDAITVRAGELTSIPVASNDVAPRGERMVVQSEVTGSGQDGELVFASGNELRYLAPDAAGTYRVSYTIALESSPALSDTGTVTVTVLPEGSNRAPTPSTLTARVLSGQSVTIDVPSSGMDADGDRVVLTDVSQPGSRSGTATISATGDSIVYRAPAAGVDGGQVSFGYTVRDPSGDTGTGTVRIGVLDEDLEETAPIAYSDRVSVQAGASRPVTVSPLANDVDPAQGELEILEITPNVPEGTARYEQLEALIDDSTSLDDGRVVIRAGDAAGTNSYRYTLGSSRTSSTSEGLIVVTVTEEAVDDQPSVADTVLTARNRTELAGRGIDVITDKVSWPSGDAGALTLSLWGDQPDYSVDGDRIVGELTDEGDLVPFRVDGVDEAGDPVVGYGFLRIPAFDDYRVQIASDVDAVTVDEDSSASFDVRAMLDLAASEAVDIRTDAGYTVQRAAASCEATTGTEAEYAAGSGAPWSDTCLVPVRLAGQTTWSYIEVPVSIRPRAPQANLSSTSRTVAPGDSDAFDLYETMTSWEGGREGDVSSLDYRIAYSGSAFEVTQSGSSVTVEARADAEPGTRETVNVSLSVYGAPSASVTLVVGAAPVDAPRGATFTRECQATSGSCSIELVGVSGEYDPFEGTSGSGLVLESLGSGARCDVASVAVADATSISVTWPSGDRPAGGQCTIPFVVSDAQGRTGTGSLTLDLQGYPRAPSSVSTVAYADSSVTLEVTLGEAARSHPELSSVEIMQDGAAANATCGETGSGVYTCVVTDLVNGEPHSFTAVAVNSVGTSAATSAHTSWAYTAPEVGGVSATPVYRQGTTSTSQGVVALSVALSADVSGFRVEETGQTFDRTGATTTVDVVREPGPQTLTVVPISQYEPPIGDTGSEGSAAATDVTVAGTGYFSPSGISASAASNTSIVVDAGSIGANANGSSSGAEVRYIAWQGDEPRCTADAKGGFQQPGGGVVSESTTLSGLTSYRVYSVKACIWNGYGVSESGVTSVFTFTSVAAPTGDASYTVSTTPTATSDGRYQYALESGPSLSAPQGFAVQYEMYGQTTSEFSLSADSSPGTVTARSCNESYGGYCSNPITVQATTAPTIVDVAFDSCLASDAEDPFTVSAAANGSYTSTSVVSTDDPNIFTVTITWTGAYSSLDDITRQMTLCTSG